MSEHPEPSGYGMYGPETGQPPYTYPPVDEPKPRRRRRGAGKSLEQRLLGLVVIAVDIAVIDQLTGRHLERALKLGVMRIRYNLTPHPVAIPAPMITALHNEARAITKEAARANPTA